MPKVLNSDKSICSKESFWEAIESGDIKKLGDLNYSQEYLDSRDYKNDTPLHAMVRSNKPDMVKFLLDEGATAELKDSKGLAPLEIATKEGYVSIVKALMLKSENAHKLIQKDYLLYTAVSNLHVEIVEFLLTYLPLLSDQAKVVNKALLCAVQVRSGGDELKIINMLLAAKADVNTTDPQSGNTPLHNAVNFLSYYNDSAVIELLLSHGAVVDAANEKGQTPLHLAAISEELSIITKSRTPQSSTSVLRLIEEVSINDEFLQKFQITFSLLSHGAQLNIQDHEGNTPLHLVADKRPELAKYLIRCGADLEAKNKKGQTPLQFAAINGKVELVKILLELKANVHVVDNEGMQLIHQAAVSGNIWLAELLLANGAEINALTKGKDLPLFLALKHGKGEMVKFLINQEAQAYYKQTKFTEEELEELAEEEQKVLKRGRDLFSYSTKAEIIIEELAGEKLKEFVVGKRKPKEFTEIVHKTIKQGELETVKLLVEKGLIEEINDELFASIYDHRGKNSDHEEEIRKNTQLLDLLIESLHINQASDYELNKIIKCMINNNDLQHAEKMLEEDLPKRIYHGLFENLFGRGYFGNSLAEYQRVQFANLLIQHKSFINAEAYEIHEISSTLFREYEKMLNDNDEDTQKVELMGQIIDNLIKIEMECWNDEDESCFESIARRYPRIFRDLVLQGKVDMKSCDPLFFAIRSASLDLIKLLLSYYSIETQDSKGRTPLLAALNLSVGYYNSRVEEIVEFLIAEGADFTAKDEEGKSCLEWIAQSYSDIFRDLVIHGKVDMKSEAILKIYNNYVDKFKNADRIMENISFLSQHGFQTDHSKTLLKFIRSPDTTHDDLALIEFLVKQGADVNAQDERFKRSCLIWAVTTNKIEIVEYLLSLKVDAAYKTPTGVTALMCAEAHEEIYTLILEYVQASVHTKEDKTSKKVEHDLISLFASICANQDAIPLLLNDTKCFSHHSLELLIKHTEGLLQRLNDLNENYSTLNKQQLVKVQALVKGFLTRKHYNLAEEREKKHNELTKQAQPLIAKLATEANFGKISLVVSAISNKKTHDLRCLVEEREQKRYEVGNREISF